MPLHSNSKSGRRLLVVAGTAHFDKLVDLDLLQVPHELEQITKVFSSLGYEQLQSVIDPDRDMLRRLFEGVGKDSASGDLVVAYYTGHGAMGPDRFYVLTRNSDHDDLTRSALAAEDLGRALTEGSKASQLLVILDTCYAAAGVKEIEEIAGRLIFASKGAGPAVFLIAAAGTKQGAEQGVLTSALEDVLANRDERLGGCTQSRLYLDQVMDEVDKHLKDHPAQVVTWSATAVKGGCFLFPNPRHRPEIRSGLDLESQRSFVEHWVPKAQGAELGVGGWYFTGRAQAMRELAAWLQETNSGGQPWVVTGGPGCGKSAVLARVVTLSNPEYRQKVLAMTGPMMVLDPATLPPEGVVSVAVHARRKLLADVVEQIASALNIYAPDPARLVEVLAGRPYKTVIVVDALDEADDKDRIVSQVLLPLVGLQQVFLLLGTRPDSTEHGRRFRALGESAHEIDLDDIRYIGPDDVALYVERRLRATEEPGRATPYRKSPAIAHTVAQAVAERARNVFLVAHTSVLALLARPSIVDVTELGWIDHLPTGLEGAFVQFLGELDARRPGGLSFALVRATLLPLAFAEGEGLPWLDIWPALATAISGMPVTDTEIALVRKYAAAFIVEALENDRSVYRLYHERVAEYLRDSVDASQSQRRIVETLRALVPVNRGSQEPNWIRAHPYILAHLASHALKADLLRDLVAEGMFIAAADPVRMLQVFSKSKEPFAGRAHASYGTAFQNMRDVPPDERLSYLEMAARQVGDDALAKIWTSHRLSYHWAVPWVQWSRVTPHRAIPITGRTYSIAVGTLDGRTMTVSGGDDGTVEVWNLALGNRHGEPLRGHEGWVLAVALGIVQERPLIVSGGSDCTLRVWDMATGSPLGKPLRGHKDRVRSVAVVTLDGRPVIVSGSDDFTVRVWDLVLGTELSEPLRGHKGGVTSVAMGTLDDRPVIVSGSDDCTVRVWDLVSGTELGVPLRGHEGGVTSVVLATLNGNLVIVSGSDDCSVRVWDVTSGTPRGKPRLYHKGWVRSVAVATLDDRLVVISGSDDRTIRVADLATGAPLGTPLRGHEGAVRSIALSALDGRPVIVSGGEDSTLRIWDLAKGAGGGEPWLQHKGWVRSVAIGTLDGRPVVVSGGDDRTVRMWDLATGTPLSKPLRHNIGRVRAVAMGTLDGQPIIVSGGDNRTMRRWDPVSGTDLGNPLLGHEGKVRSMAVGTLDGRPVIVSGGSDRMIRIWDLASGRQQGKPLTGHKGEVRSVALGTLDDRSVIVSGSDDCTVRIWDLASGTILGDPLLGHENWVTSVALGSLEGRSVIVSGSDDRTVRVWDLARGTPIGDPLRGHKGWVRSVTLGTLHDRPVIVSGGDDCMVCVWDAREGKCTAIHIGSEILNIAYAANGVVVVAARSGVMALHLEWKLL